MASNDDVPEGSRASHILDAGAAPAREAERARRRLDDPPAFHADSPAGKVFDRPTATWATTAAGLACAVILHAGLVGVATAVLDAHARRGPEPSDDRPEIEHVVDLERVSPPKRESPDPEPEPEKKPKEPDPAEEPPEPKKPRPEQPEPEPDPEPKTETNKPEPPDKSNDTPSKSDPAPQKEPTPAAAKAGKVLDSPSDSGVADFTESSGDGTRYAGGVTASSGTSDEAVRDESASGGDDGHGTDDDTGGSGRAVGLDRSSWDCPWPDEAQDLSVDEQTVVLRALVRADGSPKSVEVVSDPGFGFGDAAKSCAQSHTFRPARDDDGDPTTAESPPIRVKFTR